MMLLDDLMTHLQVNGVVTDIYQDFVPATPDDVVVLSEYNGEGSVTGNDAVLRRVQVLTRSASYETARSSIWQIYNMLDNPYERLMTASTGRWMIVIPLQSPARLSIDDSGRSVFVFNLHITTTKDQ